MFKAALPWVSALLYLLLGASLVPAQTIHDRPISPRNASYRIQARLDTETRTVRGQQVLTWRNISNRPTSELQFHLYMNAFRDRRSTFAHEARRGTRRRTGRGAYRGHITIDSLALLDGVDLTRQIEFIQPDDDNVDDRTVIRVPLSRTVGPGETIGVFIRFRTRLPRIVERTGYSGHFYMVAQWFPKIGVLTDEGWNCHQFHARSEFFADYGVYDVEVTLPQDFVVAATGVQTSEQAHGDTTRTLTFRAEDVHDFAWSADPRFKVFKDEWEHVRLALYAQPEHAHQAKRHLKAARESLRHFSQWFGEYPYTSLRIIEPPWEARQAAGMEYPTLIAAGFTFRYMPEGVRFPEMVVIHEVGHQFFYGLIGSNEFEAPWLDEGMTSYAEMRLQDHVYGQKGSLIDLPGFKLNNQAYQLAHYLPAATADPVVCRAWEFYPGGYGAGAYAKPALLLGTLERTLGTATMDSIWHTYFDRWKFRHPATRDFVDVVNEVADQDMSWLLDQLIYGTGMLDYQVSRVESRRLSASEIPVTGSVPVLGDSVVIGESVRGHARLYRTQVYVRRRGEVRMPVDVRITFEGAAVVDTVWDGQHRWTMFEFIRPQRLKAAEVDPNHKLLLDYDWTNNSRTLRPQMTGIWKLSARFLNWIQNLMLLIGFMG